MINVRVETDLERCRHLWEGLIPPDKLTDLWEVRDCFNRHFQRKPYFVVAEDNGRPVGLIPLCWIDEFNYYGYFPGETWHGQTWMEQNRIIARDEDVFKRMIAFLDEQNTTYHIRYLVPNSFKSSDSLIVDETGY